MLRFRIPGKKMVVKRGFFEVYKGEKEGFIISNHNGLKKWIFIESENDSFDLKTEKKLKQNVVYSKKKYLELGFKTLDLIQSKKIEKLVLSRIEKIPFDKQNCQNLFEIFCENYPDAFIYYFEDDILGSWIGVSPELLLNGFSNSFETHSIAGTKVLNDDSEWKKKDIEEHNFVSDYIFETIQKLNPSNMKINSKETIKAGPVKHLKTSFFFTLNGKTIWDVVSLLHPTPAVFGYPKLKSAQAIESIEKHDRELYTGYFGLIDGDNVYLNVNLRCAKIVNDNLFLFLGGGYTKDSIPELEWQETENKKKTFTDVLNLLKL